MLFLGPASQGLELEAGVVSLEAEFGLLWGFGGGAVTGGEAEGVGEGFEFL